MRRLLEARLSKHASREYVQVLRLLETFSIEELTLAIEDALQLGTISFDAVKHLLLCRIRAKTASAGHAELSSSADGRSTNHPGVGLYGSCSKEWPHEPDHGTHRDASASARTSPEDVAPAHDAARVRSRRAAVRGLRISTTHATCCG